MHKKPIYSGRDYSDRSNSDITFRDFLKKVIQHHRGFSGAAQNMDLFMHTRPLLIKFRINDPGNSAGRTGFAALSNCSGFHVNLFMSASLTGRPEQINLPFERHEKALKEYLQRALGTEISLIVTDNSTSMISSDLKSGVISLRLHRMFLNADDRVIDEVVKFVRHRGCKTPLIRRHIRENSGLLKERPPKRVNAKTMGRFHDLSAVFSRLNAEYFDGRVTARITWGTRRRGAWVRLRTLGSYSSRTHLIRISSLLDSRSVPGYFLAFVVYHEMLHADMGTEKKNGRRLVHTGIFRERERLFADYERAVAWERRWTGRNAR